ncbi:alginate export family protein [Acetobacter sacchari]|uniref:Alginate export family protein n=2 Tax=Acetobacteraceae TaxID=433 RepID=A0ABS3LVU4_9PROT|nr:alginate export family protein [Acetobacter sacchari]
MNHTDTKTFPGRRSVSITKILRTSSFLTGLFLFSPHIAAAETAPNAGINQHTPIPDAYMNTAHTTTPATVNKYGPNGPLQALPIIRRTTKGFWDSELLPTLDSRPELYAQPQSLELTPQPSALLHQGPWGVFNANTGAASGFGTVGYYAVSRWAEDWSKLRDKRNRIDFLDPLKYIPLNESGSIYLTLSGNFRHHGFFDQRAGFGTTKKDPAYRSTLRWNAGADLHLGEHLRLYGELMSAQAGGMNYYGYAGGRWRSKLDAQQAFVEVKGHLLHANMGVMVGRMTFLDAPPYITAGSVYPTVPYSWNGVRAYSFWKNFRVDLFDLTLTNNAPTTAFHDQVGYRTRWYGAYTSYAVPSFKFMNMKSQVFVDTFFMGYLLASNPIAKTTGTIAGSTRRDTPGMRIWGNAGPIEFSVGGMWQGGYFQAANNGPRRSVDAYAFDAQISWRFAKVWGRPLLGIQADDISGGDTRKSQTSSWGNFLSPWVPSAYYLDISTYIGNSNIIDVGPIATISTSKNTSLLMKVPVIWRNSTNDAIYANPTAIYAFRPHGGYTATMPQASFTWRATRHITLSIDGEYVFASKAMINAGASSGAYVQSNLELTF